MEERKESNQTPEYKIIEQRYYGLATCTQVSRNPNPFDDPPCKSPVIHLCTCAREGCNNRETISEVVTERKQCIEDIMAKKKPVSDVKYAVKSFPRCPVCLTKYCSRECQVLDHKHGSHGEKCKKFKQAKEHCEKNTCKKCWSSKWTSLSDFYPQGIQSVDIYKPCKKCYTRELLLEDTLPTDIVSDPDIQRVWIQ
jgi:hypothetical protein